ncbi:substrate-binding domain-containing protein [Reyranella sp.]|uniref:substrate-binding domain-containing protein n=1 Tax=Reyranella sp. TaxID=1929291 RepID=UPI0040372641
MKLFSTIAVQGVVEPLISAFEQAHGCRLDVTWATAPLLLKRLQAGETADALILNRAVTDTLLAAGGIVAGSDVVIASSATAIAVKAGTTKPDISTPEALERTLLEARSISYTDPAAGGASGIYFARLLERMGIAQEINAKTKFPPPSGYSAMFLASGEADLAVQQVPELLHVPGIEIVGPLPGDLHMVTVFVAGVPTDSAQPALARALIESLRTPEAKALFRAKGLEAS